ncbi:COMM domain-containing protein 4 [Eumeta japonica]|uniref:COMM domain-containing protein 4 n=1 Tax=Eumeta variegata TaxID=151549 RepID=A0A4C1YSM7_EUMVA|nr:COMM domain-containing protein 4 [Eumeta japonica]
MIDDSAKFQKKISEYSTAALRRAVSHLLFKRFKFCSEGDCPLWALAALHALGSLPVSLLRSLIDQLMETSENDDGIIDILKDTNLSSRDECARAAAVIRWTLQSAWRSRCDGAQLTRDLLVLGVPRSHAAAFAEAADPGRAKYEQEVRERPFMVNRVTDASVSEAPDGVVNALKLTLHVDDVFVGEQSDQDIIIDKNQAKVLLSELKKAYKKMEELEEE